MIHSQLCWVPQREVLINRIKPPLLFVCALPCPPLLSPLSPVLPCPLPLYPFLPCPPLRCPLLPCPPLPSPLLPSPALPSRALSCPSLPSLPLPSPLLPSPAISSPVFPSSPLPSPSFCFSKLAALRPGLWCVLTGKHESSSAGRGRSICSHSVFRCFPYMESPDSASCKCLSQKLCVSFKRPFLTAGH